MNMKAILMSIQSKWVAKILNGEKTVELRKRFPIDYRGWVYLYCTKAKPYLIRFFVRYFITDDIIPEEKDDGLVKNGLVVGRVWVDKVEEILNYGLARRSETMMEELLEKSCLTMGELNKYAPHKEYDDNDYIYACHISKFEIFDKPKELGEFSVERYAEMPNGAFPCYEPIIKAPQSWQYIYIEEEK